MKITNVYPSNIITVVLIVLSLLCLYPGLTQPIMTLEAGAELPFVGYVELYNKTQSIWTSITSLYQSGYVLVSVLIFLFSVAIPVFKLVALIVVICCENYTGRRALYSIVSAISKWSMADVFVVGIFIAFLAGQASPNMQAELHNGFYWFLSYCVISILSTQLLKLMDVKPR